MSSANVIKVMVVDDHPVMRRGLRDVLEESGTCEVVSEAADGEEAVAVAQESRPDVIVMDVIMPRKNGVESCRDILDILPDAKVLMLSASTEDDAVIDAIAAGAKGFVLKYSGSDELIDAILRVACGQFIIPDSAISRVFRVLHDGAGYKPGRSVLTDREQDILTQFANGKAYTQIADSLGLSRVTIRNTIYRVQDKLGVDSKQEIVVWAVRNGLLDGDKIY